MATLGRLEAGMLIPFGGDRVTVVTDELAAAFEPGDALIVLQDSGELLHVPATDRAAAKDAVDAAVDAFAHMGEVTDQQVSAFFDAFAAALESDELFAPIAAANERDVADARERGRSVTRLGLSERMRADMIEGLRGWREMPTERGSVRRTIEHDDWRVEEVIDRLGVVGFVFEGRPNVFADACGVLRSGNTVVFRIGSDALGTANAIVEHALGPALGSAGLPAGAASLVNARSHAAGWAMFTDPRLALAVARGSGRAVQQLGAVAQQAGNPVSLHGTGGAWIVAGSSAPADVLAAAVEHSLDRKVCNTLNTLCIVEDRADDLVPAALAALDRAAERLGTNAKLHVEASSRGHIPAERFQSVVPIARANGAVDEPAAEPIEVDDLGVEWEWEDSPEITLVVVKDVDSAVDLFNTHAPRFVASLVSEDPAEHDRFFANVDAAYVGNGFTRWVDGQYTLGTPELGLSNWQLGRLFGRSGILSGDSVFTVRLRVIQENPNLRR